MISLNDYNQLIGALGRLASHNIEIPEPLEIREKLRVMCRYADNELCSKMHKKYRRLCLDLGLIEIGYLFGKDDADFLQRYTER